MVEILSGFVEVDLGAVDAPVVAAVAGGVVVADGRCGVLTEVGRLVRGEDHRDGGIDTTGPDRVAVDVQRDVATLAEATSAVVWKRF